jgi:hypothetical protein
MYEREPVMHRDRIPVAIAKEGDHLIADEKELLSASIRRTSSAIEKKKPNSGNISMDSKTIYAFSVFFNEANAAFHPLDPEKLAVINNAALNSNIPTREKIAIKDRVTAAKQILGRGTLALATLLPIIPITNSPGQGLLPNNLMPIETSLRPITPITNSKEALLKKEAVNKLIQEENTQLTVQSPLKQVNQSSPKLVVPIPPKPVAPSPPNSILPIPTESSYPTGREYYINFINQAASNYGVNPILMNKIITCESHFEPTAQNPSGAYGIAQFKATTFDTAKNPYASFGIENPYAQIADMARMLHDGKGNQWSCYFIVQNSN